MRNAEIKLFGSPQNIFIGTGFMYITWFSSRRILLGTETYNVKLITLCKLPVLLLVFFSASRVRDFSILNQYSWHRNYFNMVVQGGEFGFFWSIHVRIDIRIEISTSARLMTTKFGKQVHQEELTQRSIIKQVLETSSCENQNFNHIHYQISYGDQT